MALSYNKSFKRTAPTGAASHYRAGLLWFRSLSAVEQEVVLKELANITQQSHPKAEELSVAIIRSGLKQTFTPCVILRTAVTVEVAISKISFLPESEYEKSFRLLLALFSIADTRRRESECKGSCTHEWHNLSAL